MEDMVLIAMSAVIGIAVLFFVVKAAVKAAILEIRAEDQVKAAEQPKEEDQRAAEEQAPQVSSKGE